MEFTYQSPLSEAVGLRHTELPSGLSLWSYGGVTVAMQSPRRGWPRPLSEWYEARRDANLTGICPVCDARWPLVRTEGGVQWGSMEHEAACILTDSEWVMSMLRRMLA